MPQINPIQFSQGQAIPTPLSPIPNPIAFPSTPGAPGPSFSVCSTFGPMYSQSQWYYAHYRVANWITPGTVGGLIEQCQVVPDTQCANVNPAMLVRYRAWTHHRVYQWAPEGFYGCTGTAPDAVVPFDETYCPELSAFNSFRCGSGVLSSYTSMTGLGTEGVVVWGPAWRTRAAGPLDPTDDFEERSYLHGCTVTPSPTGYWGQWADIPHIAEAWVMLLTSQIKGGNGYFFSDEQLATPQVQLGNASMTEPLESWDHSFECSAGDVTITTTSTITTSSFITTTTTTSIATTSSTTSIATTLSTTSIATTTTSSTTITTTTTS